jgi:hypothetical protein
LERVRSRLTELAGLRRGHRLAAGGGPFSFRERVGMPQYIIRSPTTLVQMPNARRVISFCHALARLVWYEITVVVSGRGTSQRRRSELDTAAGQGPRSAGRARRHFPGYGGPLSQTYVHAQCAAGRLAKAPSGHGIHLREACCSRLHSSEELPSRVFPYL